MRILRLPFTLMVSVVLAALCSSAQDFSNKGMEFWLAYCYHVGMVNPGGPPTMTLYITSDVATTYSVEIFGGPVLQAGTISAGQVVTSSVPPAYFISDEGVFNKRAIHITSVAPVVVYSYITRSQASAATLCLPTPVLGKEYYSMNFTQVSNEPNSNSYVTIVAADDNTVVEITPSANTKNGWLANSVYTVTLNKGDIYQVLGQLNPTDGSRGVDLTGTHIRSISSGATGCKKIAVFSGSGKVRIPESCTSTSADNLYQQLYPVASWGLKYLTAPSYKNPYNYYRIAKSNPLAKVHLNGALIPASSFVNGIWYEFMNNAPNMIQSDLPISVAQYFTTQSCAGNGNPYDPDMVVLNPVEQNIEKVTLVSSNLYAPGEQLHHLQAIVPNGGTGISSFRLDGSPVNGWLVHPSDPRYSYAYFTVTPGYHTLSSDSGFNALAYGYASAESYAYSAGANVKDLYQFMSIRNQYATVNFPASCRNSPFHFSMVFPYQPAQIAWKFFGLFADTTLKAPRFDSTWVVNDRQLYRYTLPRVYSISSAGQYQLRVLAQNTTSDGCSGEQQIDFDLEIFNPPTADFSMGNNGCATDSVHFLGNANTDGRSIIAQTWSFGDGDISTDRDPVHLYSSANTYAASYSVITDVGCISDTVKKTISISSPPLASFSVSVPACQGKAISLTDQSSVSGGPGIAKWTWDFGDGSPKVISTSSHSQSHAYAAVGTSVASLEVETASGCKSVMFEKQIQTHPLPVAAFGLPASCLSDPYSLFTDSSSISDGTQGSFSYLWDFGDNNVNASNPNSSTSKNPRHTYSGAGPYTVRENVTSGAGCVSSLVKSFFVNGAAPVPSFRLTSAAICSGDTIHITDNSLVSPGKVVKVEIYWDYNNDSSTKVVDDEPGDGKIYAHTYPSFASPAGKTVIMRYLVYSGQNCAAYFDTAIALLAKPDLHFDPIQAICNNVPPFQITQAGISNGLPGKGMFTGSGVSRDGLFSAAYAREGADTLRYGFDADNGCSNYVDRTITVYPVPVADAGPDKYVLQGGVITLTPLVRSKYPVLYSWTPATWLNNAGIETPRSAPLDDITCTLTVISDQGCKAVDNVSIKVLKAIEIPNIFSPNQDGSHDRWEIPYLSSYPNCSVDVYNRYGQLVFHSVGYDKPWDGTVNGNLVPVGTYYYIIDPRNGRKSLSGYVDIIR